MTYLTMVAQTERNNTKLFLFTDKSGLLLSQGAFMCKIHLIIK